ncbi:MAG: SDR family oxidoreductase [Gammaproteobacteria bacterium]|nr:MAG: SDR family oxidoreductase [Gammaproteobacteria bacterium]
MSDVRIALVTGGSRGIGRAIAERLLDRGYRVAVGYHQARREAESVAGSRGLAVAIDINDGESVDAAITEVERHFGPIDTLINNAGIVQPKPFLELDEEDWVRMLSINLLGAVRCTRRVIPHMVEAGFGRIVNLASVGGQWGGVFQIHYAAAKAGLINFTKSLAKLYSRNGITCNAVAPGLIQTDMITEELADEGAADRIAAIPAGRIGTPGEVAAAVECLCTVESGYISGQTINVNGGMYLG